VFPLGMYAASTWQMDKAMTFGFFEPVLHVLLWIAAGAWALTFSGMLRGVLRGLHSR
jgi:tellurite resistance protein TehA-like permease